MRSNSSHIGRIFLVLGARRLWLPRFGDLGRTEDRVLMMVGIIAGNIPALSKRGGGAVLIPALRVFNEHSFIVRVARARRQLATLLPLLCFP